VVLLVTLRVFNKYFSIKLIEHTMKKYTIHFLLITLITLALGFSGIEFTGASVIRFICLVAGIGLMVSCLDAVILSKRNRKLRNDLKAEKVKNDSPLDSFNN